MTQTNTYIAITEELS